MEAEANRREESGHSTELAARRPAWPSSLQGAGRQGLPPGKDPTAAEQLTWETGSECRRRTKLEPQGSARRMTAGGTLQSRYSEGSANGSTLEEALPRVQGSTHKKLVAKQVVSLRENCSGGGFFSWPCLWAARLKFLDLASQDGNQSPLKRPLRGQGCAERAPGPIPGLC